jgi:riboflavin kinase/FMN adenylyltransferase
MRIFRHTREVQDGLKGAVVAVGNFDGVHRGHQALIGQARQLADERNAPLGVLAFEPHPQEFFHPAAESFRLTPLRTKARLIAGQNVDVMYALAFDAELASKSAQEFVMEVLVEALAVGQIVVGPDFRFGKGRAGDSTVLSYMGEMEGFGVTIVEPVEDEAHGKISSTRIRDALKAGKPEEAARLLGHWWTIEARVEHGDKRGRTIGVPTRRLPEACFRRLRRARHGDGRRCAAQHPRRRRQSRRAADVRNANAASGNLAVRFRGRSLRQASRGGAGFLSPPGSEARWP